MNRYIIKTIMLLFLFTLPWACSFNEDQWRRASDKIDDVPPQVVSSNLSNGAGITSPLVIRFNDDMMHDTLHAGTIIIKEGADLVPGTFTPSLVTVASGYETQVSFTPDAGYDSGTSGSTFKRDTAYTVTVTTGVRDYYGNNMESDDDTGDFATAADFDVSHSINSDANAPHHTIVLTFTDPPAPAWTINVTGTYNSGVDTFNGVYHPGDSGVTSSETSRTISLNTGVTFDAGTGVTVTLSGVKSSGDDAPLNAGADLEITFNI